MRRTALALLTLSFLTAPASANFAIPDSTGDRIMLFSSYDGSLINADWLTDVGAIGWAFSTPKEAKVVGSEIWVADQIEDAVHRFDFGLNFLSSITTGPGGFALDNVRSLGTDGTTVWVTNDGGTFADSVVSYDTAGNPLGSFLVNGNSPFDAEPFMGDLLVSDSGADAIQRHATNGAFISSFATGLAFPEQVVVLDDNSVIVANAIDAAGVEGVWHYNSDGSVRAYVDTQGMGGPTIRGANLLGNGNYIISASNGIWTAQDLGGGNYGFNQVFADANGQYVTLIPEPGVLALLALGGLAARRRRPARAPQTET